MVEDLESPQKSKPSKLWYLLPIFFGILGGIAAYLFLQDKNKAFARKLLILSIILQVLYFVVAVLIMLSGMLIFWITPLSSKQQGVQNVRLLHDTITRLNDNILTLMVSENAQSVNVPYGILWTIDTSDNSILARMENKLSDLPIDEGWIQLNYTNNDIIFARADTSGDRYIIQYKIKLNPPWKIETVGKLTSDKVKQINLNKSNNSIQIQLIE